MRGVAPLLVALLATPVVAMESMSAPEAIQDAIRLGQTATSRDRPRFHAGYRVIVGKAPVDYLEIVTPFRRVELAAETRTLQGDRTFGQRQARELLAAEPDQLDLHVELTFSPLNTFVGVPDYVVTMVGSGATVSIDPRSVDRVPRFGARLEGRSLATPAPTPAGKAKKGLAEPVLGGTIIARFNSTGLDPTGSYDVVIGERLEKGVNELARIRVDLSKMR